MQSLTGKATGDSLPASEWNQLPSEVQNVITSMGITLSSGDLEQLGKAIAGYSANGTFYVDSGVADAYVASPVGSRKVPPSYADGMRVIFYAGNTNTGASTVNVGALGVKSIKTMSDGVLAAGAIVAGGLYEMVYSASAGWFRLLQVAVPAPPEVHSIGASVAANALTITIPPQYITFRSTTLTNGDTVTRQIGSTISMTVSSGSTLGTLNAVAARLAVLAIDNAGTVEVAVVNLAGGVNLSETGLITTTAEGGAGAADSASVIYSTTTRTNVAYRVVGLIDITEATAGTWATAPTLVQGAGGNAFQALQSLGYGQTWQDVTGSRSDGVTYYNQTGRPIFVSVSTAVTLTSSASAITLTINGIVTNSSTLSVGAASHNATVTGIVPPGGSYLVTLTAYAIGVWAELR